MFQDFPGQQHPRGGGRIGEYGIRQRQHRRGRAERDVQRLLNPGETGIPDPLSQQRARGFEPRDIGALERKNRLFPIPHREYRPRFLPRPLAREKLLGQSMRDRPLLRRGILHLIQQKMIETAVELVEHPLRARVDQQGRAPPDQVVEFQQTGRGFSRRVLLQQRPGEIAQRFRDRRRVGGADQVVDGQHAVGFRQQRRGDRGIGPVQNRVREGTGGIRFAILLHEQFPPDVPTVAARGTGLA